MNKRYNEQEFECKVNNHTYIFYCWTENTRYGFRHLCKNLDNSYEKYTSKCCYYNRTWERFRYESVLSKAIEQLENDKEQVRAILIEGKAEQDRKECEQFFNTFQKEYNKLPNSTKETLKNVTVNSEEQAKTLLTSMKMINILNGK